MLAERYGVKGQTLRKQYKEKISDYRNWDQLEHAHDYLLYPENIGENLSLDETCLSNGDVYTILTNKADEVNPFDDGAKLGAETLVDIMRVTGNIQPLEHIAEQFGYELKRTH